jgi:ELWxxDGT repeat protein
VTGGNDNFYYPTRFVVLGDRALFGVDDGVHGNELWATDGTAAGTAMVADVCPGACSSLPRDMELAGDRVYFAAEDGAHGIELWRSDGTAAGTVMVADLAPGLRSSSPTNLAAFGSGVAFAARVPGDAGWEPWFSDGTAGGTMSLGDLYPGPFNSFPEFWTELNGELFFSAGHPVHGRELWATDGTPQGTHLAVEVLPGPDGGLAGLQPTSTAPPFVALPGRLVFVARDAAGGLVLWSTDGTQQGSVPIRAMHRVLPYGLGAFDGRAYFSVIEDENGSAETSSLWATDGTAAGTELVAEIGTGWEARPPRGLRAAGGRLYFTADDGVHGQEPWVSDGTTAGTAMLADLNPGVAGSAWFHAAFQPVSGGALLFVDDGVRGIEPWFTDGTAAGTVLLVDINPGPPSSWSFWLLTAVDRLATIGGKALFRAWSPDSDVELWATDGTPGGTEKIEINDQSSALLPDPFPGFAPLGRRPIGAFGAGVLLRADDGVAGAEPWISDGTPAGTTRLADLYPGIYPSTPWGFIEAEHGAVFSGRTPGSGDCCTTWSTDGTTVVTLPFETTLDSHARLGGVVIADSRLPEGFAGNLVATDGSPEGTFDLGVGIPYGYNLLAAGDHVYFGAEEPFRTDGQTVEQIAEIRPGPESANAYPLAETAAGIVFAADDGVHGQEPWSIGVTGLPQLLADVEPGAAGGVPPGPGYAPVGQIPAASAGGRAFFLAGAAATGEELWSSDGTPGGTALLADVFPGPRSSEIRWLTAAGERAFFVADDGVHGREPWVSDGTPEGTHLLTDLVPGSGSSSPAELTAIGDRVYFAAHSPAHGRELWRSDGTAGGTVRVTDIAPGPIPSSPMALTVSNVAVWFVATDAVTGFELYRLPVAGTLFADGFEGGDTSVWSATEQ